jgi:hypothetical protein
VFVLALFTLLQYNCFIQADDGKRDSFLPQQEGFVRQGPDRFCFEFDALPKEISPTNYAILNWTGKGRPKLAKMNEWLLRTFSAIGVAPVFEVCHSDACVQNSHLTCMNILL